jgi:NADPH-dependent 2,4-dienoyl-CoA reductase/sulfur reductase-like enzyme
MKRRDFILKTATGTVILASGNFSAIAEYSAYGGVAGKFCNQSARKIPVDYSVDVVIVGGSTAAVAAAVSAAQNGAKVFLVAQETYLGEDVCGTCRYWNVSPKALNTTLGRKLFGNGLPVPLKFKQTLDNELINNKIEFLFSSYVTDLLIDMRGNPAGVVLANRSGRQAVRAKVIIDATPRAMVSRLTDASFTPFPSGKQNFRFIVIGNDEKKIPNGTALVMPQPVLVKDKEYKAIEYSIDIEMKDLSFASFANAEQLARDLTWDPNQVESGDLLFQVPPYHIVGKSSWESPESDIETLSLTAFQPRKVSRFYLLNGVADIHRTAAADLLKPGGLVRIGERIGKEAADVAAAVSAPSLVRIIGNRRSNPVKGDVGELLDGIRPTMGKGLVQSETTTLPVLGNYDVVVMGGGTAGAPAAVGAARHGAKTIVLEYLHGLGGIGTLGMVGRYYHGYRKGFTNEVDRSVKAIGEGNLRQKSRLDEWVFDWKTEYFRREIRNAGGDIWFGVLGCGAFIEKGRVKGVVVATPEGKGVILAHTVIDSSGSADIAIAAGAGYVYTDGNSVAVQGAGMPFKNPDDFYNNTDWTFTDDTDMLDIWWTFIVAKDKFKNQYDIGKLSQTRERRRMAGDFTISALDIYNGRTYPDAISIHVSSFDTHGFTEDPFFFLKPPEHSGADVTAYVPFRSLLPKGIEGIAVTGLGASADRDAMPVIRMQPCLQNQGYAVGWAAAIAAVNNQLIRNIDLKGLQKELVKIENLPVSVLSDKDNYPPSAEKIREAATSVTNNLEGLEILLWDKDRSIPILVKALELADKPEDRLTYARILAMLGNPQGWQVLQQEVERLANWDTGWNYTGMGQFGKSISYLDGLIIALGRTKKAEAIPILDRLSKKLTLKSEFSHFRAVAMALETIADSKGSAILYDLLNIQGITGHSMPDIETARRLTPAGGNDTSTRNNSLRELILARALFRCGDINGFGKGILEAYSKDLRGHYYRHASGVLNMYSKVSEIPKVVIPQRSEVNPDHPEILAPKVPSGPKK